MLGGLVPFFLFVVVAMVVYVLMNVRLIHQTVTLSAIAEHYNVVEPEAQQSMHLLLRDKSTLNPLQQLQFLKLESLTQALSEKSSLDEYAPKLNYQNAKYQSLFAGLTFVALVIFSSWFSAPSSSQIDQGSNGVQGPKAIRLLSQSIAIEPPKYSLQPKRNQSSFDVSALVGSKVSWRLSFNQSLEQSSLYLVLSSGEQVAFEAIEPNVYQVEFRLTKTSLYRIEQKTNQVNNLSNAAGVYRSDLHTITVIADEKPKIRILSPKATITETSTQDSKQFSLSALISDDFAVERTQILASIAKGSGEAVKFRDQVFTFDKTHQGDNNDEFIKSFDLLALGMEPGDELYFSIHAWDNKTPEAQFTRSETKIIRWLEDGDAPVLADGILIDFMPEYFKSQRQIIIETKELIAEQESMSKAVFVETSELLGVAQSELKEKYGQYLGDESEEGGLHQHQEQGHQEHGDASDEEHHEDEHGEDERHSEDAHQDIAPVGHDIETHASDDFEMQGFNVDHSGQTAEMQRFGHNHGEADIGLMTKQDPKALMKRSLANMWQAELHLMLSEPAKALPYEEEALKYLKMAKKADRIYVKRLGFEPPPVSEQRRYQGELDDIQSRAQQNTLEITSGDNLSMIALYNRLDSFDLESEQPPWQAGDRRLLEEVKATFSKRLATSPQLIDALLTLEKMLEQQNLPLAKCLECRTKLQAKLWQFIEHLPAKPNKEVKIFNDNNTLIQGYQRHLSQQGGETWN